jgi:hypothetical protein
MRISEILVEAHQSRKQIKDDYGGTIIIVPDPDKINNPSKFSISYINQNIASFYGVKDRLIGIDSHGHIGKPEPHLHVLQSKKDKSKGYIKSSENLIEFPFSLNLNIFFGVYNALIRKYKEDKNAKNYKK